jgi:hypothetical protein
VTEVGLRGAGCGCPLFCLADLLLKANPELLQLQIFTSTFVNNGRGFDFVRRPLGDLAGRVHRPPLDGETTASIPVRLASHKPPPVVTQFEFPPPRDGSS